MLENIQKKKLENRGFWGKVSQNFEPGERVSPNPIHPPVATPMDTSTYLARQSEAKSVQHFMGVGVNGQTETGRVQAESAQGLRPGQVAAIKTPK